MPARTRLTALDARRARAGYNPTKPAGMQPSASKPFKMADGAGLWLDVRPTGKKVWRYRYKIAGKENVYTAGDWIDAPPPGETPEARAKRLAGGFLTLEEARAKRTELRALVRSGKHPRTERETSKAHNIAEGENTFKAVAEAWYAESAPHWAKRYAAKCRRLLDTVVYKAIGDRPIRSITSAEVLELVRSKSAKSQALLLQQWLGSIFRYAIRNLRADTDPTYAIRGAIKRPPTRHHQPLALSEIPAFLDALRAGGNRQHNVAIELLLRTFVRPGELREAKWAEFDLDAGMWVIPAERMKMGEPHYVPLSTQAVALLRELHKLTCKREYLFPSASKPNKPINHTTLWRAVKRAGLEDRFSPHGFRATASTALNGMHFRPDVIEKQLAHSERDQSRASYNQQAYMEERKTMMQTWADVIDAQAKERAKVVPIRSECAA